MERIHRGDKLINVDSLQRDWIYEVKAHIKRSEPQTIEKLLRAYYLCEQLSLSGLDFIFKGGTCLTLLTNEARRFSTDVDIITEVDKPELETRLGIVCQAGEFTAFELDERRSYKQGIPKAHYAMKYKSVVDQQDKDIQLDILFTESHYSQIQGTPIVSDYVKADGDPIKVQTPTLAALMGDKLTAFAPTTVGVPYGRAKEREIIKQLYDLGVMFDMFPPFEVIAATYRAFVEAEISYRAENKISREDVLKDTLKACEVIARRDNQLSGDDTAHFNEIEVGFRQFYQFPINDIFRIEQALAVCGKVSFVAAKLLVDDLCEIIQPPQELNRNDWMIPNENQNFNFLNRKLRGGSPEAQFYWYKALELLGEL